MIEVVLKAAALLALGGIVARRLAGSRPAMAHFVWTTVFLGALLLPLLAWGGPRIAITVPEVRSAPTEIPTASMISETDSPSPHVAPIPHSEKSRFPFLSTESMLWSIWGVGVLLVTARYALGWKLVNGLRKSRSYPVEAFDLSIDPYVLAARVGIQQNWELRQSATPDLATAMTWGVRRPVVLLPHDADSWPSERLEAVLLHEFAHVRRRDFASQLLAEAVCALYWFNPLAWHGAHAMREVAESAADDAVLRSGVKASDYATQLLQLAAEISQHSRAFARIGVSVMSQPKIESRLRSVLSPSARHRGLTSVQALATVAIAMFAITAMSALTLQGSGTRSPDDQTEALKRMKLIATAAMIYANDYDEVYPYAQNSDTAKSVMLPYSKYKKYFESPTPGARFEYNLNLGGIHLRDIEQPAEVPVWYEVMPRNNASNPVVGFVDGHGTAVTPDKRKAVEAALKKKFPRRSGSSPLPKDYRWGMGG